MNDDRLDSAGDAGADPEPPPHLDESVRRVAAAGRETLGAGRDTARALRRLVRADLALARGAIMRSMAWLALAAVFGVSAWLLLVVILVLALHALGLGWLAAAAVAGAICLVATALAGWRTMVYLDHAGMHATRRQLARLGLFRDEQDEDDDGEGDAAQSKAPAA